MVRLSSWCEIHDIVQCSHLYSSSRIVILSSRYFRIKRDNYFYSYPPFTFDYGIPEGSIDGPLSSSRKTVLTVTVITFCPIQLITLQRIKITDTRYSNQPEKQIAQ